jgi:enoyl-CoA hydratase
MTAIRSELRDNVTLLTIDRPPVNALNVDTLDELTDTVEGLHDADAVVLTGTGSIFSAGADLWKVLESAEDPAYIDRGIVALSRNFEALFTFPRPLVGAVNGHALAGGAILTSACDYRVMAAESGRIGAVELAAGVPFPAWALEILRFAVNNDHLQEVVIVGRSYKPADAQRLGLIDEVVPPKELMERALKVAGDLAAVPRETFSVTKEMLRAQAVAAARASAADTDERVKAAWRSPEVVAAVRRTMESLEAR